MFACTEPTEPRFQIEQPFYLVEGDIADRAGYSEIRVSRSDFGSVQLKFEQVVDATVTTTEEGAGTQVPWSHDPDRPGTYLPPPGFAARPGDSWSVTVLFSDGTQAASLPEQLPPPVSIGNFRVIFDQEGEYDRSRRFFVPVFRLLMDYTDPESTSNFYQWDFRYWEEEVVCATCEGGVYREGKCVSTATSPGRDSRYDYACEGEEPCFRQTRSNRFNFGSDRAFDGSTVTSDEIGTIEFTTLGGILVEGILFGLTAEAYGYGKVVADIVEGSTGLNATIPAALNGNLRDPLDETRQILGYVRVVSVSTARTYLLRNASTGTPSPNQPRINYEPMVGLFVPPRAPCRGQGRALGKPEGWP